MLFRSNGHEHHLEEGRAYVFDNTFRHSVINPSDTDRVHLVFDTVGPSALLNRRTGAPIQSDEHLVSKKMREKIRKLHVKNVCKVA